MPRPAQKLAGSNTLYALLLFATLLAGLTISWLAGRQFNDYVYDAFFRAYEPKPWVLSSVILAIDEDTLGMFKGIEGMRKALATGLQLIHDAHPRAVAIDIILADSRSDDDILEPALAATPKLILPCDLAKGRWELPDERLRRHAAGIGEVHASFSNDGEIRSIDLMKVGGGQPRLALSVEAYRIATGAQPPLYSPTDIEIGGVRIPAVAKAPVGDGYNMRIRYVPKSWPAIPRISIAELVKHPERARLASGKVVFAGITAQTAGDRWMTPASQGTPMPGIEVHANAYETIANQLFLTDAPDWWWLAFAILAVVAAGCIWHFSSGLTATLLSVALLGLAHYLPYLTFTRGVVMPYVQAVLPVWLAIVAAASWQYFFVRRRLGVTEAEKDRYQQAIHFVTHEMRTPLTAIQGSSQLIERYPGMPEAKRKQINEIIVSESQRLGKMINVFLSVERLSAGDMELTKTLVPLSALVGTCIGRARPLGEQKQIGIMLEPLPEVGLDGDRELLEYAFYNLLTNAIKYSPSGTEVRVAAARDNGTVRLSVRDQGIGMEQKEVRRIFEKFYRTRRAEQSGETGTGIGLSIVDQIVTQHGGSIEVESAPGVGSCFTLVLPSARAHE